MPLQRRNKRKQKTAGKNEKRRFLQKPSDEEKDDDSEMHELTVSEEEKEEIFGNITSEDVQFATVVAEVREPMSLFWQDEQKQTLRCMDVH